MKSDVISKRPIHGGQHVFGLSSLSECHDLLGHQHALNFNWLLVNEYSEDLGIAFLGLVDSAGMKSTYLEHSPEAIDTRSFENLETLEKNSLNFFATGTHSRCKNRYKKLRERQQSTLATPTHLLPSNADKAGFEKQPTFDMHALPEKTVAAASHAPLLVVA